jgi:poly(ADP-ribose) glycohydrolase
LYIFVKEDIFESYCRSLVLCKLSYFWQADTPSDKPIIFERYVIENPPDWQNDTTPIQLDSVELVTDVMEKCTGKGFVDFANMDLHIGTIISSMTQEEVLFSCCPELFIGILFVERFRDDEIMIIKDARRFSNYSGYGLTFQWTGIPEEKRYHDIVVIDACMGGQYYKRELLRDLNKAWYSFEKCGGTISTGHWGCGAFGGNKTLKFLQQLIAATKSNTKLYYSTYKDEECKKSFSTILQKICQLQLNVSQIYLILKDYNTHKVQLTGLVSFEEWIEVQILNK